MVAGGWTVSRRGPTAGTRLACFWPAVVATELNSLLLQIDADPRLAAAAGGVARYLADVAGFDNDAIARLQSGVIAAWAEAFGHVTANHQLQSTFTHFSDRMEVALPHLGDNSPAIGLDT